MNKREILMGLLDQDHPQDYIPAAFFLHFDPQYHRGEAAVEKHLEFFRNTGMDFVKIQYEHIFPHLPEIQRPEDWKKMPYYGQDFFEEPLKVVEGLVDRAKSEALVLVTLYSPFMCARHTADNELVTESILANPEAFKKGIEVITESLFNFVRGCIDLGVDGFYHSTQGGEAGRFPDITPFLECVKPYDLRLMEEINSKCEFNILHICDYESKYDNLAPFLDYPGHIVNTSLELVDRKMTAMEVYRMFKRPFMGGMERKGAILTGQEDEVRSAALAALKAAPERFILGADCTVPSEVNWNNLRIAIETAHNFKTAS